MLSQRRGASGVLGRLFYRSGKVVVLKSGGRPSTTIGRFEPLSRPRIPLLGWLQRALLLAFLILFIADNASAQAAAEYAGAISMGGAATQTQSEKKIDLPTSLTSPPSTQKKSQFAHLRAKTTDKQLEANNRRDLEQRAGENAGKLLLRSVPSRAQIWIDGKRVGRTPLLLIIASGKYKVRMEGSRREFAQKLVDLRLQEKKEVVLNLEQRYPSYLRLR